MSAHASVSWWVKGSYRADMCPHACARAKFQPISEESVCMREIGQVHDQGSGEPG